MKQSWVWVVVVSTVVALGVVKIFGAGGQAVVAKETAYERVVRTGVLRCGYGVWQPAVTQDLKTGEMGGVFVELMRAAGELGGFKVEWVQETDWGTIGNDLAQGKIDAHCAGMWPNSNRGRQIIFSDALFYMPIGLMVRADDVRFPTDRAMKLDEVNRPEFKIGYIEGDVSDAISKGEFPNTTGHKLPLLTMVGNFNLDIVAKKYDMTAISKVIVDAMMESGVKDVRYVALEPAPRVYGSVNGFAAGEQNLRDWVNAAIRELVATSRYDRIMQKYEQKYPGGLLRPTSAYGHGAY